MSIPPALAAAGGAAAAQGRAASRAHQCNRQECVQSRLHKGRICAALYATLRDNERLRASQGVQAAARGDNASLRQHGARVVEEAYDSSSRRENQAVLTGRLEAIRALVRERNEQGNHSADDPIVRALEEILHLKRTQVEHADEDDFQRLWEEVDSLDRELAKKKKESDPLHCGICMEPFFGNINDMAMTGKNCFHPFHPLCIAKQAMMQVQPTMRHDPNDYWRDATPDALYPRYELREEVSQLDEDNERVPTVFPSNVWVQCPVCRDRHFANRAYYDQVQEALQSLNQAPPAPSADDRDWVQRARDHHAYVLLAVPGDNPGNFVMLVPAKEFNRGNVYEEFANKPQNGDHIRGCGFTWGNGPNVGGRGAYYRVRRPDDELDPLDKFGGRLSHTTPRGAGTGSWRFDYGTGTYARLIGQRAANAATGAPAAAPAAAQA